MLDRYVLAKARQLVDDVTRTMDAYDLFGSCAAVRAFVDALTNWYIRRSRQRFWDGDVDAIDTLHTVLDVLTRVSRAAAAVRAGGHPRRPPGRGRPAQRPPDATGPMPRRWPPTTTSSRAMDEVRDVCSATLSVRKAHGRRVRQPLSSLTVAAPDAEALAPFVDIIADEVNVRDVQLTTDVVGGRPPRPAGGAGGARARASAATPST